MNTVQHESERRFTGAQRLRRWLLWLLVLWLGLSAALVVPLRWWNPPLSALMVRQQAAAWWRHDSRYPLHYRWVDWEAMSLDLPLAVVAAEDQRFPQHHGFDWQEIQDAWAEYQAGKRRRGASTISQQVAKNLYLWPAPSLVRKGLEAYLTIWVELCWSKRRILEIYLNIAEFGVGVFGVAAASDLFFNKSPASLTEGEAALLAAVLPSPRRWRVTQPSPHVLKRRAWIQRHMRNLGGVSYVQGL